MVYWQVPEKMLRRKVLTNEGHNKKQFGLVILLWNG